MHQYHLRSFCMMLCVLASVLLITPAQANIDPDALQTLNEAIKAHGGDSQQAYEARLALAEYFWQSDNKLELLPYIEKIHAYQNANDIKGKEKTRTQFKLGNLNRIQGNYDQCIALLEPILEKWKDKRGESHPKTVKVMLFVGICYSGLRETDKAISMLEQVVQFREQRFSDEHPKTGVAYMRLASAYRKAGRFKEAEKLLMDARSIFSGRLGKRHRWQGKANMELGKLYRRTGELDKAERVLARGYAVYTGRTSGIKVTIKTGLMTELGRVLFLQGRYDEAAEILEKAAALREKHLGPGSDKTLQTLLNLARVYIEQEKYPRAIEYSQRAINAVNNTASESYIVAYANRLLATAYLGQDKIDQAHTHILKALSYLENHKDNSVLEERANTVAAQIYLAKNQPDKALQHAAIAVDSIRNNRGSRDPNYIKALSVLANAYEANADLKPAIKIYRQAMNNMAEYLANSKTYSRKARVAQEQTIKKVLVKYLELMVKAYLAKTTLEINPANESFMIAENARSRLLQSAMLGMSARASAGNSYLAELVRKEQDLRIQLGGIEEDLIKAISTGTSGSRYADRLQGKRKDLNKQLKKISQELDWQFPEYQRLMNPKPISVKEMQGILAPGEVMLSYLVRDQDTLLWSISQNTLDMYVIPMGRKELSSRIRHLRRSLDTTVATLADVSAYDVRTAHLLYKSLIAPAASSLKDARHVIIVPHGPLLSLPFGALVSKKIAQPQANGLPFSEYKAVPYFARQHAISLVPSATALVTLRKYAKKEVAELPFIGFGDPLFGGESTSPVSQRSATSAKAKVSLVQRPAVDVDTVQNLPRLPETADELKRIAQMLNADEDSLYLGKRANEANVKTASLEDYRVVVFATHALVSGDLDGLIQPALALTPPENTQGAVSLKSILSSYKGSDTNDGLLMMGEVLGLKLNAEWVVLSACNTAAADGTLGGEGLTGLANAFFYAGSKALLVSLWPVVSSSTQRLTTALFEASKADASLGRAQALARARLTLIDGPGYLQDGKETFSYAHPIFWAAFIVVGEGG
ncbi:MAG: tetratricopeptide repeat protein [Gammaproteobacteria bacterium]|nr:MAG: tetratricopeptide repeat protein [Gammaproteobacteria bacterium]